MTPQGVIDSLTSFEAETRGFAAGLCLREVSSLSVATTLRKLRRVVALLYL
jgi:hypothetical protein